MKPSHFGQANLILKGTPGSDVIDLPVFHNKDEGTVTSLWIPSDEERDVITNGGGIILWVLGDTQPPVMLGAAKLTYGEHHEPANEAPQAS